MSIRPFRDIKRRVTKVIEVGNVKVGGNNRLNICLKDAFKEERHFESMKRDSEKVTELLDIALNLEGLPRHCSTHAAGVVISSKPLTNFLPLYKFPSKGKGEQDEVVTQYSMGSVEKLGLLKMDFLGLKTLTVIDNALRLIKESLGVDLKTVLVNAVAQLLKMNAVYVMVMVLLMVLVTAMVT